METGAHTLYNTGTCVDTWCKATAINVLYAFGKVKIKYPGSEFLFSYFLILFAHSTKEITLQGNFQICRRFLILVQDVG